MLKIIPSGQNIRNKNVAVPMGWKNKNQNKIKKGS